MVLTQFGLHWRTLRDGQDAYGVSHGQVDSMALETHVCIAVTSPTGKRESERALGDLL